MALPPASTGLPSTAGRFSVVIFRRVAMVGILLRSSATLNLSLFSFTSFNPSQNEPKTKYGVPSLSVIKLGSMAGDKEITSG